MLIVLKLHRVQECILAKTNENDGNSSVMLNHVAHIHTPKVCFVPYGKRMFSAGRPFSIRSFCFTFQSILKHRVGNNCRCVGSIVHAYVDSRYMQSVFVSESDDVSYFIGALLMVSPVIMRFSWAEKVVTFSCLISPIQLVCVDSCKIFHM